jgi:hypothetical protein
MTDPPLIYHSLIAIVFFEGVLLIAVRLMEGYDLWIVKFPDSGLTGIVWRVAATLTRRRARCVQFRAAGPEAGGFLFLLMPTKRVIGIQRSEGGRWGAQHFLNKLQRLGEVTWNELRQTIPELR